MAKKTKKMEESTSAGRELLTLANLSPAAGSRHRRKIVGRGEGSGLGKTSGKGGKGQTARSGAPIPRGFEGGQMPLHRRLPKIGFSSRKKLRGVNVYSVVSLNKLNALAPESEITLDLLKSKGLVGKKARLKILGGTIERKINVEAHAISASAKAAIEQAGGAVSLIKYQE